MYLLSFESDETTSSEMSVNFYQITRRDIHRAVILWYSCCIATGVAEGVLWQEIYFHFKIIIICTV